MAFSILKCQLSICLYLHVYSTEGYDAFFYLRKKYTSPPIYLCATVSLWIWENTYFKDRKNKQISLSETLWNTRCMKLKYWQPLFLLFSTTFRPTGMTIIWHSYAFLMPNCFQECSLSLGALLPSHIQYWNYIVADIGSESFTPGLCQDWILSVIILHIFNLKEKTDKQTNTYYIDVTILFWFSKILKSICSSSGLYINRWQRRWINQCHRADQWQSWADNLIFWLQDHQCFFLAASLLSVVRVTVVLLFFFEGVIIICDQLYEVQYRKN